ncbi:TetR/AcrR family transcriptional regulator [Negadavirga shengliensis]|uniref:TetR/AcrR family transcriptional regulator n=1 Tax=Negadavirga shengliensis TaxID=1389218 RepID=A0ABV9SW86_9BACT
MDKTMNLFWSKGYFDTSAQDIVDTIELSRSSIYNTFKDKKTLFIASLRHYIDKESKGLLEILSASKPHPSSIRRLMELVVESSLNKSCPKGCFLVNTVTQLAATDIEINQIVTANIDEVATAFQDFIEKAQRQGSISLHKNARGLAIILFHQMTAIRVTSKVISDKFFFTQNIDTMMELFNS